MTTLRILILLTIFGACNSKKHADKSIISTSDSIQVQTKFSLIDTLNKYASSDSLFVFDSIEIYIGRNNSKDFALVQINDTTTFQYQRNSNQWSTFDTLHNPISYIKSEDVNGDNFEDLIVTYGVTASGGNSENICLIYNPTTKQLRHNEFFDLPNIHYDKKSKLVFSAWWTGISNSPDKMSYIISGDSLIFKEGVTYVPDEISQGKIGTVEFYIYKDTDRIVVKKIKGNSTKMFNIFSKALWDSSDD